MKKKHNPNNWQQSRNEKRKIEGHVEIIAMGNSWADDVGDLAKHLTDNIVREKYKSVQPAFFVFGAKDNKVYTPSLNLDTPDQRQKDSFNIGVRMVKEDKIIPAYIVSINEAWYVVGNPSDKMPESRPSQHPEKKECVVISSKRLDGMLYQAQYNIDERDSENGIVKLSIMGDNKKGSIIANGNGYDNNLDAMYAGIKSASPISLDDVRFTEILNN